MIEGLWTAEFESLGGRRGTGVVVLLADGSLLGGDSQYFYKGRYTVEGLTVKAFFEASAFVPDAISVFGLPLPSFTLSVSGIQNGDEVLCRSTEANVPFVVKLRKRS